MKKITDYQRDLKTLEGKAKRLCTAARQNARKRGEEEPTLEFFIEMLRKYPRCKWTGHKFTYPSDHLKAPSLDRIDSSKGYYEDNIHVTTWQYNQAKSNKTDVEVLEFSQSVVDWHEYKELKKQLEYYEEKFS